MALLLQGVLLVFCVFLCCCNCLECSSPDKYKCRDGTCIKAEFVCDGQKQCADGSDEEDCAFKLCRLPDWHRCADNKTCISTDFLCDGMEHCPMGDDEDECGKPHKHPRCSKFEFTCADKTCVPLDMVCDGHKDCPDDSDEKAGCDGIEDHCHGFVCKNKKCLESHTWVCDGYDDCGDGSDEIGCVANCKLEDHRFLCKDNNSCILLDKVCDGFADCADKSDEEGVCKSETANCDSLHCPTPSKCHKFPSGPECICPKGYKFDSVKKVCLDINECENFGVCSQGCNNTMGSYRCTCASKFKLERDGKTCVVRTEEPFLLYTAQESVVGIYLTSRHVYHVATNLSQVVGLDYDGTNIYWTDIKQQSESIVRAREDGSNPEIVLSSGLEAPEDLAIDWLAGNIYFTDNIMKHVAVCSNHGFHCAVLVVKDVDQPRGIALNPYKGLMYWTDWGKKPIIGRAAMDGTHAEALINKDVYWPNGITLDIPNDRFYWADAKIGTIESAHMDGSDRRVVPTDILEHPYGIAVFEDKIYWSDWGTKSIHSCHKFTGKHHEILAKAANIYDISVYHSAKQPKANHACMINKCSHLCLLSINNTSTCACPDGMVLEIDQVTCKTFQKKQGLGLGLGNYLATMEHAPFGRHKMAEAFPLPMYIHKIAFNSLNGTFFIADNSQKSIYEVHITKKYVRKLASENIGNITALAFDHLANNLYWADSQRQTVEVLNMRNMERAIAHHFTGGNLPIALAIIPEEGKMFVTLHSPLYTHIDISPLHGRGVHHHVVEDSLGADGIQLYNDPDFETVFWLDTAGGKIEFSNYEGSFRHLFRTRLKAPVSMALVDDDLVWTVRNSKTLYYTHKSNLASIKKFELEIPSYVSLPEAIPVVATRPLYAVSHVCNHNNGGCSHICVSLGRFASACLCPPGLVFKDNANTTCIDALDCEFRCTSGECLTASRRCNGRKDCADGSDEKDCGGSEMQKSTKVCSYDQFACHDGTHCVPSEARCDRVSNCDDKSDEENCETFDHKTKCHTYQHLCDNGRCIDLSAVCDTFDDCGDNSDEKSCEKADDVKLKVCGKNMFKCITGTCILKNWECDGHIDCTDGSDEHDKCDHKTKCHTYQHLQHLCDNGRCIDLSAVCDTFDDCGDNSDEKSCEKMDDVKQKVCGKNMFKCITGTCIPKKWECDGHIDCTDGSDEHDKCDHKTKCHTYQHLCDNGRCIDLSAVCDTFDDCGDNSDEKSCEKMDDVKQKVCGKNMFKCITGTCILKKWECDGHIDCTDGSDEHDKCESFECPQGSVKCELGHCIDKKLLCDGNNDCGDNSDESNCDVDVQKTGCADEVDSFGDPIKFQCTSEPTMCLDIRAKCNGTAECPRGEDEFGCTGCSIHEFQCRSTKECIRKEFRCDGEKDCDDGSDEVDCQSHNTSLHHHFTTFCHEGMFHCKDGTCIDQLRVCDGSKDCDGGEDEGSSCKTACVNHGCQQKCTPSPYGAVCSCNEGYRLNGDKKTCSDINECAESQPCAQICENEYGSYRCGCFGGFMLRPDKTSCKSIDSEHYILFTSANQMRKLSEHPMSLQVLWSAHERRITGLDVNMHRNKSYFTLQDATEVFEYDLHEKSIHSIQDEGVKSKLAVDWVTDSVYVIDYAGRYSIKVCTFHEKSMCVVAVKFPPRNVVKAIALDAANRQLFYVVVHFHIFEDAQSILYKAGLDGSKREVLLTVTGYITSIECDVYKKLLYFIDKHSKSLKAVSYDGGAPKIIIRKENVITNPSGLTIFENTAFIVNKGSSEAVKCQLYGDLHCQAFNLNVYNAEEIVVAALSKQKPADNICKSHKCSLICVQGELGPKCLFPDGEDVQLLV